MDHFARRRQLLLQKLNREKDAADAVLVTAAVNVTYLTGFTGEASYLVASEKNAILVSDHRFETQALEDCPGLGKPGFDLHIRPHDHTTLEATAQVLGKGRFRTAAVEADRLTVAELETLRGLAPKISFVPRSGMVESLRAIKDASEIEHIRQAIRVAERAIRMFLAMVRETDTEKEMADSLDHYLRRCGARAASFPCIAAVGDRGALPHAPPTPRKLNEGSKLLVDWGADLLYKSDITRTFRSPHLAAISTKNKYERTGHSLERIHAIVLKAQSAALAAVRDGVNARDVDAAARKVLADAGLGEYFTHGLGHGIGLEVHEAPRVRANSDDVLVEGMVITIEPGVYIPGWGGVRIEDDVLVTRDGCTLLTSLPRDLSALT
jgi:Xaa-Pro aminopeptidase